MDKTNRAMALIAVRKQNKGYADELLAQYKTGTVEDVEFLDEVLSMSMSLPEPTAPTTTPSVVVDLQPSVQSLKRPSQSVPQQMVLIAEAPVSVPSKRVVTKRSIIQKPKTYDVGLRKAEKTALRRSHQSRFLALPRGLVSGEQADGMLEVFNYYGVDFTLDAWLKRGIKSDRRRLPYDLMKHEITPSMVGTKDTSVAAHCAFLVAMRLWLFCEARHASECPGKFASKRSMTRILDDLCASRVDVDGSTVRRTGYIRPECALAWAGGMLDKSKREVRHIRFDLVKQYKQLPPI